MKKSFLLLSVFLMTLGLLAGSAAAFNVQINLDQYYANGVLYDTDGKVSAYNIYNTADARDLNGDAALNPDFDDAPDSEAVGRVSTWLDTTPFSGGTIFDRALEDYEITIEVSGIEDIYYVENPDTTVNTDYFLYSVGLTIDVYMDPDDDFSTDDGSGAGPDADTIHLLQLVGHDQIGQDGNGDDFTYSLSELGVANTNTFTGEALLDVVEGVGLWWEIYDTNTKTVANSAPGDPDFADFSLSFSLNDSTSETGNPDAEKPVGWALVGTANTEGVGGIIPEPATMVLMGIGLLGIAGVSRRRES